MITGKITETLLTGLTSTLSDYDCTDGNLQICHNFVNNGAGLQALQTAEKMKIEVDGEEVDINYETFMGGDQTLTGVTFKGLIFEHKTSNGIILIGIGSDTYLYWYDKSNSKWRQLSDVGGDGEKTCTQVGNILIVNTSNGLHYLVFKNFTYKYLGQSVPELDIDFKMSLTTELIDNDDIKNSSNLYQKREIRRSSDGRIHRMWTTITNFDRDNNAFTNSTVWDEEDKYAIENGLFGGMNYIYSETAKKNQFIHPFFVRYALKLYDGSYVMHSAPIMMTPSDCDKIHVSVIHYGEGINNQTLAESVDGYALFDSDGNNNNNTTLYRGSFHAFFTYSPATLNCRVGDMSEFDDWKDIIQEVCIFASPQISSYTATGKYTVTPHAGIGNSTEGSNITGHDIKYLRNNSGIIETKTSSYRMGALSYNNSNYNVANIEMPSRDGTLQDWVEEATNNFRLIRSYTLDELTANEWKSIKREGTEGLRNLNTCEQLIDGYAPRRAYKPSIMHVYNSRLNMANCIIAERDNFPANILGNVLTNNTYSNNGYAKVYIEEDGVWQVVTSTLKQIYRTGYISYPNPNAKWICIKEPYGSSATTEKYYKLKTHPYLYSAYSWSEQYLTPGTGVVKSQTDIPTEPFSGDVNKHNYIYTTAVDNPFVVETQGVNAVGNGDIISIQTTTQAMSEGTAFGAQPLSVFATDGIYALQVNAVGLYDRAAPVSRETIKNGTDVLAIDNSVIFLSDRGLMQLNGSRTTSLSADLQAEHPTVIAHEGLPKWFDIHKKFYNEAQPHQYLEAYRFLDYISNARLAFDYIHYRVYVYDPDETVAFVYNIGTKTWSTCDSNFKSSVQGYPATIVNMTVNGNIVIGEFTQSGTDMVCDGKGLYLTRPIKFKEHDILKTIRKVKERGIINSGNAKYLCLYGSDDMLNWELIAAKVGDEIPRLSGKPYKYFVVAGWSKLGYNRNVVSRLTIEMKEKYTNKIR